MMRLLVVALIIWSVSARAEPEHAKHQLGNVSFPVTCNAQAQRRFNIATAWLHSFEYEDAKKEFQAAAAEDPQCAMAYWGVAMSNFHPLWAPPTPLELLESNAAIEKAMKLFSRTKREQEFIKAIDTFYSGADKLGHAVRIMAYVKAMERLYLNYPDDDEAAVFYALSLIAAGTLDADKDYARENEAAAILNGVLARQPRHPGVAHYLIHGYDYPALAHFALPAARIYSGIAPASAHAQHMPSHIFTRMGLWGEAVQSNLAAEAAAQTYARTHGLAGAWDEQLHAIDYLAYAYLQLGQEENARRVLERLSAIQRVDPPNFKVAFTLSAVPARFALERRAWSEAAALELPQNAHKIVPLEKFGWALANIHFARAVGAARSGDIEAARRETALLEQIRKQLPAKPGEYDWGLQVEIQRQISTAWLTWAEGQTAQAVTIMKQAALLDEATEKHPVTPGSILPAREQVGELLLALDKPGDALAEFEASLNRAPGRFNSILGAARAARHSGKIEKAKEYYAKLVLLKSTGGGERIELGESVDFLGAAQRISAPQQQERIGHEVSFEQCGRHAHIPQSNSCALSDSEQGAKATLVMNWLLTLHF